MPSIYPRRFPLFAVLLLPLMCNAWAAGDSDEKDLTGPLTLSPDGAWVLDRSAQLQWPRCVEGMRWNGKACTGVALLLTRRDAIAHAQTRATHEGVDWRLPSVNTLRHLAAKHKQYSQAPLFAPLSDADWYWAVTVKVNSANVNQYNYGNIMRNQTGETINRVDVQQGWAVNLRTGQERGDMGKKTKLPVRLVLAMPQK